MPCYDHRDAEEAERTRQITVRLACEYCHLLEAKGDAIPEWARAWWADHKRRDVERGNAERGKRQ